MPKAPQSPHREDLRPLCAPAHSSPYIRAHLGEELTLAAIAQAAGASPRALQESFRRFRDATVTGYVRELRLRRWRELLEGAGEGDRVSHLALEAGLEHFGRAAALYRARFGEAPSVTRGRAIGRAG